VAGYRQGGRLEGQAELAAGFLLRVGRRAHNCRV
jgi:hypothetical protein